MLYDRHPGLFQVGTSTRRCVTSPYRQGGHRAWTPTRFSRPGLLRPVIAPSMNEEAGGSNQGGGESDRAAGTRGPAQPASRDGVDPLGRVVTGQRTGRGDCWPLDDADGTAALPKGSGLRAALPRRSRPLQGRR